tara:strand:- start:4359 stop:5054 length:696 start_codon:yes stop_codon:yes gene_type:complete
MKSTELLKTTVYASLIIQILTSIANVWVLNIKTHPKLNIVRELVYAELTVQVIEAVFYAWLAYNIVKITNITPKRYYDWFITTPTMLLTLVAYFIYLRYKKEERETDDLTLYDIFVQEGGTLFTIALLNIAMLGFGFAGEIKKLPMKLSVFLGFICFAAYFYIIYKNYVVDIQEHAWAFYLFVFLWALYGISALLPYTQKNIGYNILDLFSKNFFGVFLTYILYTENQKLK